ncbi:MAG: CotH kinase family protein [Clostridia bacterium]|nr:CotH kinase family protein [Clostridia bacterium]
MKKLYFALMLTLALLALTIVVGAKDISIEANETIIIEANDQNTYFMPSFVSPTCVKLLVEAGSSIKYMKDGVLAPIEDSLTIDLTGYETTDKNGEKCYIYSVYELGIETPLTFYFANSLPSVHITTTKGADNIIQYNGKDDEAEIFIVNKDGTFEYSESFGEFSELKVRGNTTDDYAKKPFRIKLGHKTLLFGMSNDRSWVLLANYLDQSLIRNNVMYQIAKILGMDMCDFRSVDLFIDGEYYGIYLLCEKVEIDNGRVNIHDLEEETELLNGEFSKNATTVTSGTLIDNTILTEYRYVEGIVNPEDITGGYLIELDNNYYRDELCYFVTENNSHYVIKSPEYASREQVEYIAGLFAEMEEAIMSSNGINRLGKHYTEYIELDTFVYAYIIAELGRNYDAGSSSMYFYKDRDVDGQLSKIQKGPLWDCDNTLGNIHKNGASSTEGYWAKERSIWAGLTAKADFNQRVTEVFTALYTDLFDMIDKGGFIEQQYKDLGSSVVMERARWRSNDYTYWPTYYDGTHYDRWQPAPVFNFVSEYSNGVDGDNSTVIGYLCEHIEARANWLATEWGCDVALRERVLNDPPQETLQEDNTMVIIIVAVASLVAVGAVVAVIIIVKKRKSHIV